MDGSLVNSETMNIEDQPEERFLVLAQRARSSSIVPSTNVFSWGKEFEIEGVKVIFLIIILFCLQSYCQVLSLAKIFLRTTCRCPR